MKKYVALAVLAGAFLAPQAVLAEEQVAGKPALSTKSTKELIEQREKWGTAPTKTYKD
ncbi:MAG: hypothetical protein NW217_11775 [Hyphomicrobiaceae bacterium]|nr:hypothetical protein [Hyphomicrobiaceae bacterium]